MTHTEPHRQPATTQIPITTGPYGQPYLPARHVVNLIAAVAVACRALDPDHLRRDSRALAAVLELEADAIDCRAAAATTAPSAAPAATHGIPVVTGPDGQPHVPAADLAPYLRFLAGMCRRATCQVQPIRPGVLAEVLDQRADELDCQAIAHTTQEVDQ
ncbi:hypothetical protein GCM10010406_21450 [Streptomyces thermolineatus]|uniref:Uncharacterized protein n=1 Tax=Streptomyces thermolineatus TaxID=44033 RepID=A0ABN3LMW0_9ACTN